METLWRKADKLFRMKLRFAASGLAATSVDYGLYLLLVGRVFSPAVSNVISYSCSVVVNFLLQKKYVFQLQRSPARAFAGSMIVSGGGLLISTAIVHFLSNSALVGLPQYLIKLIATGIVFFYNFYFKRYVFERRFFEVD